MLGARIRVLLAAGGAGIALAVFALPAGATISGGCTAQAGSLPSSLGKPNSVVEGLAALTQGGATQANLTTQSEWDVPSWKDYLFGEGHAPGLMKEGHADAVLFGFDVEVASGSGNGGLAGAGGPLTVQDLANKLPSPFNGMPPAKRVFVHGGATPADGAGAASQACSGDIVVVFNDVSALDTLVGRVGAALFVLGGAGVLITVLRR